MDKNNMSKVEMINALLIIIKKQNKLFNEIDYEHIIDEDIKKLYRIFNQLDRKVNQIFEFYKDCPINKQVIKENDISELKINQNFILEWQEITPYTILSIEEKGYTQEELLEIIAKKIKFIQRCKIDKEIAKNHIDQILDAYNELIKKTNKKR